MTETRTPTPTEADLASVLAPSWVEEHLEEVMDAVERACKQVAFSWYGIEEVDDLAGEVLAKLVKIERSGRLERDLRVYGWPKSGEPESVTAVVYGAAKSWAGGICSDRKKSTLQTKGPAEVLDAILQYGLVTESPRWDDMPQWVAALGDAILELTEGELRNLERFASGDRVDKSNVNRSARKLADLAALAAERERLFRSGPGNLTRSQRRGNGSD